MYLCFALCPADTDVIGYSRFSSAITIRGVQTSLKPDVKKNDETDIWIVYNSENDSVGSY
jgi:hypothetical protein